MKKRHEPDPEVLEAAEHFGHEVERYARHYRDYWRYAAPPLDPEPPQSPSEAETQPPPSQPNTSFPNTHSRLPGWVFWFLIPGSIVGLGLLWYLLLAVLLRAVVLGGIQ